MPLLRLVLKTGALINVSNSRSHVGVQKPVIVRFKLLLFNVLRRSDGPRDSSFCLGELAFRLNVVTHVTRIIRLRTEPLSN